MASLTLQGAKELAKNLPAAWSAVKSSYPALAAKIEPAVRGRAGSADQVVEAVARSGNTMQTSAIIKQMAGAGVPIDVLQEQLPALTKSDVAILRAQASTHLEAERAAVNAAVPTVAGPDLMRSALYKRKIAQVQDKLNFGSADELLSFVEAVHLLDAEAVKLAYSDVIGVNNTPVDIRTVCNGWRIPAPTVDMINRLRPTA